MLSQRKKNIILTALVLLLAAAAVAAHYAYDPFHSAGSAFNLYLGETI